MAAFHDLKPRLVSGIALAAAGAAALYFGGAAFALFCAAIAAAMLFELAGIVSPDAPRFRRIGVAALGFASCLAAGTIGVCASAGLFGDDLVRRGIGAESLSQYDIRNWAACVSWTEAPGQGIRAATYLVLQSLLAAAVCSAILKSGRAAFAAYGCAVLLGASSLALFRVSDVPAVALLVISVVVATDTAGYFAGRVLGGPKLAPSISPGKTWSGAAAGWVAAAAVGLLFERATGISGTVWASVALSVASQLGDLAESRLKRRADVADSSSLIPGHGGVLDRFDGMTTASLAALALLLVGWAH